MHSLRPENILSQCHCTDHKTQTAWPGEERAPERRDAGD